MSPDFANEWTTSRLAAESMILFMDGLEASSENDICAKAVDEFDKIFTSVNRNTNIKKASRWLVASEDRPSRLV
jgi:hypothetical protein